MNIQDCFTSDTSTQERDPLSLEQIYAAFYKKCEREEIEVTL